METVEAPTPFFIQDYQFKLIESKKYELKIGEEIYSLLLEIYSDNNIYFKLRKTNNSSFYHYMNKFNYNDITQLFLLQKEHYKDMQKIFHFFDLALTKKKIKLEYNEEKRLMILKLNKILDFDEIECKIELKETKISKDEMFNLLYEEINGIKNNNKGNLENTEIINKLTNKISEHENRIKNLEDEIRILKEEIQKNKIMKKEVNKIENNNLNEINESNERISLNMMNDIFKNISEFNLIKKNIFEKNEKYLMINSESNQGNNIIKYILNKAKKKYIELIPSKFNEDKVNEQYYQQVLNYIKNIMKKDYILILMNFDNSLYDIFTKQFISIDNKKYLETSFKSEVIFTEVNNDFNVIVIENNIEKSMLLNNKFEKQILNYNMFLEKKDFDVVEKIIKFLYIINCFNKRKNLDLEYLLINCQKDDLEGFIFKIKNDIKLKNNSNKSHWIFKEGQEYEDNLIKLILNKIVPLFCQYIIYSLILALNEIQQPNYMKMKEYILEIYKQSHYNDFDSYFNKINSKRSIIYTFTEEIQDIFKNKILKNKFDTYDEQSILFLSIESIKNENNLITELKSFLNSKNKQLLLIVFNENELIHLSSVFSLINNYEKDNQDLINKTIIFIIRREGKIKEKTEKIKNIYYSISFINEQYEQIFIDNLEGKENNLIYQIIQKNNNDWFYEYLLLSNFIEENINIVLNNINYTILFETEELNKKNIVQKISNEIIKNNNLKKLIINNLVKQGEYNLKHIFRKFLEDFDAKETIEEFFKIIDDKIRNKFILFLLAIIIHLIKYKILIPLINNFEMIMKNEYLKNIILTEFDKIKFNFKPCLNKNSRPNKLTIYSNLRIPKINQFRPLKNEYLFKRFLKAEGELRKHIKDGNISISTKKYFDEINLCLQNLGEEINKIELLKVLFESKNNELNETIIHDILYNFIIYNFEKENSGIIMTEKLLNFMKLILRLKLSENNYEYKFNNSFEELEKIVLFIYGYNSEIKNILKIYLDFSKYCNNIEERIEQIFNQKLIIYEISSRNKNYTKIVNNCFYFLIEAILRCILAFSLELIKIDKTQFRKLLNDLNIIEKIFSNINMKFFLFSKELINFQILVKIKDSCKSNEYLFENNYEKIIIILLNQSLSLYKNDYEQYYKLNLELINIIKEAFNEQNDEYFELLFFIFYIQYYNINSDYVRIKLIEYYLSNKLCLTNSKIFLSLIFGQIKPEMSDLNNNNNNLIQNFMNFENNILKKYKGIIKLCNELNSKILNEVLLHFFEGQCQLYFNKILNKYKNIYSQSCCKELLSGISSEYLIKAIKYLESNNNLLKLYAIAYIKTYCYFYVEIYHEHYDCCNWQRVDKIFDVKDKKNKLVRNMIYIYIWKLYYKKYENFEAFKIQNMIPFIEQLKKNLNSEKEMKDIIMETFEPLIYDQKKFPDIQYYTFSNLENINTFTKKFNSSEENKKKYVLINSLLDVFFVEDIERIKYLNDINILSNLLRKKYSFKISREDAKNIKFKNELEEIKNFYNKIYNKNLSIEEFNKSFIEPFFNSWDKIKEKSVQYKCRVLRDVEKGENPLNMNEDLTLNYFLVDDGDRDGGIFLASAYQHMIYWQNRLLNLIIEKNEQHGPLSEYVSQLEQEVDAQDASIDEIINIDDTIFEEFENIIRMFSMRDIIQKDNKINYKNYNEIIYDFYFIEKELGKLILKGKKRFTTNIKFNTFLYEGFRGENGCLIVDYREKYGQRELDENEKKLLFNFIKENKNNKIYIDIFSSLQILIAIINEENYNPQKLISNIINNLPNYIIINKELIKFLNDNESKNEKLFTIDCLISIFEIFEALNWENIKQYIPIDYQCDVEVEDGKKVLKYFEENKNKEELININNFTSALRKFISRSISGTREEIDIRPDSNLILYITRNDLWKKNIMYEDKFDDEIYSILSDGILVLNAYSLYNILNGDNLLNNFISEKIYGEEVIKNNPNEKSEEKENEDSDINDSEEEIEEERDDI